MTGLLFLVHSDIPFCQPAWSENPNRIQIQTQIHPLGFKYNYQIQLQKHTGSVQYLLVLQFDSQLVQGFETQISKGTSGDRFL